MKAVLNYTYIFGIHHYTYFSFEFRLQVDNSIYLNSLIVVWITDAYFMCDAILGSQFMHLFAQRIGRRTLPLPGSLKLSKWRKKFQRTHKKFFQWKRRLVRISKSTNGLNWVYSNVLSCFAPAIFKKYQLSDDADLIRNILRYSMYLVSLWWCNSSLKKTNSCINWKSYYVFLAFWNIFHWKV